MQEPSWFTPEFADDDTLAEPIDFSLHDRAVAEVTGAPDNSALADQWREQILDQLLKLTPHAPAD